MHKIWSTFSNIPPFVIFIIFTAFGSDNRSSVKIIKVQLIAVHLIEEVLLYAKCDILVMNILCKEYSQSLHKSRDRIRDITPMISNYAHIFGKTQVHLNWVASNSTFLTLFFKYYCLDFLLAFSGKVVCRFWFIHLCRMMAFDYFVVLIQIVFMVSCLRSEIEHSAS